MYVNVIINKDSVKRNMDKAARLFERAAFVYQEVADRLLSRLQLMKIEPQAILDLSHYSAYTTPKLRKIFKSANVMACEPSMPMLQLHKSSWFKRKVLRCDAWSTALPIKNQSVDLVFANFLPTDNLMASFQEIRRVLRKQGLVLFTLSGPDTLKELRASFATVDQAAHIHTFMDMHDVGDLLLQAQLQDPVMDMEYLKIRYTKLEALFKELKALGVQNSHLDRLRGLYGRHKWQAMRKAYQQFVDDGKYPATLELIYGHAWAGELPVTAGINQQGEAVISINSIIKP